MLLGIILPVEGKTDDVGQLYQFLERYPWEGVQERGWALSLGGGKLLKNRREYFRHGPEGKAQMQLRQVCGSSLLRLLEKEKDNPLK